MDQRLAIDSAPLATPARRSGVHTSAPALRFASPESTDRRLLEHCVADRFERQYEARIEQFLPLLLSLDLAGQPGAVAGLRCAERSPLFLEQYLDVPVEQAISRCFLEPVDRDHVVEIGNLVSRMPGAASMLFAVLPLLLEEAGVRWVVCTATPQVRAILGRLHFPSVTICAADPEAIGDAIDTWGKYYDSRPTVIAGDVRAAAELARRNPDSMRLYRSLEGPPARFVAEFRASRG